MTSDRRPARDPEVDEQLAEAHGLDAEEYERLQKILDSLIEPGDAESG